MKPVDIRNATWAEIEGQLTHERLVVHAVLREVGPVTTRDLAAAMERDKDSVAPRVTELYQLGFVELVGKSGRRGLYRAVPVGEARRAHALMRGTPRQLDLRIQA
jgi:DNA-binding MarR family transcriptional regulator